MGGAVSACGACGGRARKRSRVVLVRGKEARAVWACGGCFKESIAFLFVPAMRAAKPRRASKAPASKGRKAPTGIAAWLVDGVREGMGKR